ncbi:open rectifier K[+] channel 1 isoform X5 [Bombus fervidus]|uniref:open rectifier K[+] channel 1 isoform X5 n=1 Tax=Bombus fervidus TaxID=203811 RepID=UPI003AB8EF07
MSKKQWLVLLMLFLTYLLLGASIFYHIESRLEIKRVEEAKRERIEINGQDNSKGSGFFFMLYKTFLICWISFGLGYTVMIMTFIARGMRSKKITRIEHKLAINLKHTQSKIWNEFNKEINYLRRAFNELQLSKVKRVYIDECNYEIPPSKFPRSNSFPDLRDLLYGSKEKDKLCNRPRRRANSEVVPTEDQITRVVSETDLQRIDKTATFATHAMVQPAELLARLVNILGYIPPATEDIGADDSNQTTFVSQDIGYRGNRLEENNSKVYSEEEPTYTSSTGPGLWTIGHEKIPAYRFTNPRSRAASEIRLHETMKEDRNTERTWSGPTAARKINELMKSRISESSGKEHGIKERKFSKLRNFALTRSVSKALVSSTPWKGRFSISSEKKNSKLDHEINRDTGQSFPLGSVAIDDRRDSTTSNLRRHYYTHTGAGSNLNTETTNNLLEETSLADFLRALTALHASVVTNGSWTSATNTDQIQRNQPRRKMGTASLTPPKLPSLFTLFSPSPPTSTTQSNQNTITQEFNVNSNENKLPWPQNRRESRRGSLIFVAPTTTKSRRFSLRPVATPISPPTPPKNDTPFLSDSQQMPYGSRSTSLFESLKEPLISTERAPGLSTPIKSFLNDRRFSLRPTQNPNGCLIDNNPAALVPTLKAVPRWKAGMLQRQISQMNLRRRARAFSLSDVHAEDLKERAEPFDLSSSNCKKHNYDAKEYRKNISPNKSEREDLKNDGFAKSIENSDQFASSVCTSVERYSSFSQESALTNSVRLEEKNVRIFEPHTQSILSIASTENINHLNEHTSCPPLNIYNEEKFASSSTEKQELQESLVEVKIENPITNIVRNPFTADVSLNNSPDSLSELKVEKHGSHLPINKS